MPFSDPMADGPAIQAAGLRALKAGQTLVKTLQMAQDFRAGDDETPIVLMGYYNPIYIYGVERFLTDAKASGIDGLIVVDLPPEMDEELCVPALKAGLNFIRLATPTTDDKRLPKVLQNTSGFVYYVSMTGITGSALADTAQGRRRGQAHQGPHRPAGLRRLRRQDRRTGAHHRRVGRRRRGRHGDRQCRRQCHRPEGRPDRRSGRGGGDAGQRPVAGRARRPPCSPPNNIPIFSRNGNSSAMNWITNFVRPKINSMLGRRDIPENLWIKDPESGEMVFHKDLESNQYVIPSSGHHMKISAKERLKFFFDNGEYETLENPKVFVDPLKFRDEKRYIDRLKEAKAKTGLEDAILNAAGTIEGLPIVATVQDFAFMGGSLGMAAGEAIVHALRNRACHASARWCCLPPPAARACRKASCR